MIRPDSTTGESPNCGSSVVTAWYAAGNDSCPVPTATAPVPGTPASVTVTANAPPTTGTAGCVVAASPIVIELAARLPSANPNPSIRIVAPTRFPPRAGNSPIDRVTWYAPAKEAATLRMLAPTPVPAPRLLADDLAATVCDVPALLQTWLPGQPCWRLDDLGLYLARTAETLVAIHALPLPRGHELPVYAPYAPHGPPSAKAGARRRAMWERVAAVLERPRPVSRDRFIHRDYHPGNIQWDGAGVSGVIDWLTAARGPAGIDLARMRQNLVIHVQKDTAERFAAAYVSAGGDASARHPFWDLLDAVDLVQDLDPDALDPAAASRFEDYVESVLAEC